MKLVKRVKPDWNKELTGDVKRALKHNDVASAEAFMKSYGHNVSEFTKAALELRIKLAKERMK